MSSVYKALKKIQQDSKLSLPDDKDSERLKFLLTEQQQEEQEEQMESEKKPEENGKKYFLFGACGLIAGVVLASAVYFVTDRTRQEALSPLVPAGEAQAPRQNAPAVLDPNKTVIAENTDNATEPLLEPPAMENQAAVEVSITEEDTSKPLKGSHPQSISLFPEGSNRLLTEADLEGKNPWDLKIMRNEIYARHSYIFNTGPMQDYFQDQSWYTPRFDDVSEMLSEVEKENIRLIKNYEKALSSAIDAP